MKKTRLLIYAFLVISLNASLTGQEIPVFYHSQYIFNPYLVNPAFAGSKDFSILALSARQNIERIANAPNTQILSFHTRFRDFNRLEEEIIARGTEFTNMAAGGYLYKDDNGPFNKIGMQATYAYHLPLDKSAISHLAFGISFSGFLYTINYWDLNTLVDPLIAQGRQQTFVPDANIGAYYYGKAHFVGVSVYQLFESPIKWGSAEFDTISIQRNYFLYGGYRFLIQNRIIVEPSLLVKTNDQDIDQFYNHLDINLRIIYLTFSVGASYRMNEGMAIFGQYQFRNLFLGLAYEYPFSKIWNYNYGTVEVNVGFNLGKGKNRFGDNRYW
jgi:type IX secretion system PorP/SprF family membrane protein